MVTRRVVRGVMAAHEHLPDGQPARTRGEPAGGRQREEYRSRSAAHRLKCTVSVSPGATLAGSC